MKKLVVSMFIMAAASFFIVCGVSAADTQYNLPLNAGETVSPTLSSGYYNVTLEPGQRYYFNWSIAQNGGASNISMDGISPVSSGSNYAFILSQVTTDTSSATGTSGHAEFVNIGSSSFTIDCSVSITFTLRNNNNTTATPRVLLTVSSGQKLSSGFATNNQLNNKLNQILESLGESSGAPNFLGDDAYLYFDNRYFSNAYVPYGSASPDANGFFRWSSSGGDASIGFFNQVTGDGGRIVSLFLSPGQYFFISSITNNAYVSSIVFEGVDSTFYSITSYATFSSNGYNYSVTMVTVDKPFACNTIYFNYGNVTISNAVFYGAVVPADDDFIAGEAVNPDQSGLVSDVDNAGQQQQAQEDQLWTNINSYKGDLTFNIDDWSEAAGGLSYVAGIFMMIWNNSPTQVIVLSLMLGIAMLSIGRGAMAAVRVSRNRRDDD